MDEALLTGFLASAVRVSTPLLLAALGETLAERGGVINLGIEGAMLDLSFEPRIEAPVPVGWPAPTTVNELMVLDYPAYRLARAPMSGQMRTNNAFWKLFRHIESNQIPMTAPVETTYSATKG